MSLLQKSAAALLGAAALFQFVPETLAGDLKAPFDLESAKVLPAGVRNPRFKNVFMSVGSRFNGIGGIEPLGNKLNKVVTWDDLRDSQKTQKDLDKLNGVLLDPTNGLDLNAGPGETTGVVNTFADVKVPVLAMGITDRFTLAVAVPIFKVQVETDTGFKTNSNGTALVQAICTNDVAKCNEAADKLNTAVSQKLNRLGYNPIKSQTISGIGDMKVVGKYLVYQTDWDAITVKSEVTMPTGIAPNADNALDVPTGDGQWDVGAGLVWDHRLIGNLSGSISGAYVMQLPDQIEKRLPVSSTDSLSKDKELLDRKLGDIATLGLGLSYDFPRYGMTVSGGYNFQFQKRASYSGTGFQSYRYSLLEDEFPCQALHSATLVTGFSTVDWYKQKKFVLPFQANLAYSRALAGRNVTSNDVVTAELVLFF